MNDPKKPGPEKCSAHLSDGSGRRCGRWPVRGSNVCPKHGGSAPQTRRKAQDRILAAADSAAAKLIEFMNDKRVPHPVRLAAARDLLDRAGLNAKATVEIELAPWQRDMESIVVDGIVADDQPAPEPTAALPSSPLTIDAEPLPDDEPLRREQREPVPLPPNVANFSDLPPRYALDRMSPRERREAIRSSQGR